MIEIEIEPIAVPAGPRLASMISERSAPNWSARRRLADQRRNASQILHSHERERREIADRLHEQAARTMAAAFAYGRVTRTRRGRRTAAIRARTSSLQGP
jgi:glucose-6-phosphate-specific signal transduction histidine kinase